MNFNSCANLSNFDLARQFYNWAHFFLTDMDDLLENLSAEDLAALEKTLDGEESRFCEKQEWMEKQAQLQPVIREKREIPKDNLRFCPITKNSEETEQVKDEKPKTRMDKILSKLSIEELNELEVLTHKKEANIFKSMNKSSFKSARNVDPKNANSMKLKACDVSDEGPIQSTRDIGRVILGRKKFSKNFFFYGFSR